MSNFGICNPIWIPNSFTDQDLSMRCDDLLALGITWIRTDFLWNVIQPTQTSWNWQNYDRFVTITHLKGLKILPVLDYSNGWANGAQGIYVLPTDPNDFANFAAIVASRYAGQGVDHFEIWNEPNNAGNMQPKVDAAAYSSLLQATYSAIKNVQPNSTIIMGGLAPMADDGTNMSAQTFLQGVYAAIGSAYFDAVNYHPYGWNTTQMSGIRDVMSANNDSAKDMWLTEYGNPTNGTTGQQFVSEDQQSSLFIQTIKNFKQLAWSDKLFFYNYQDSLSQQPDREAYFGIRHADGTSKKAYVAIQSNI